MVENGRIAGVEDASQDPPDGCELTEFREATILPGLIDMHVHLCGDGATGALDRLADYSDDEVEEVVRLAMKRHLEAGITTVRDLGDRRWAVVDFRDRFAAGTDSGLAPSIVASGPPITSPRGHCWSMGGEVEGTSQLRAAVAERKERRVDVVKIMTSGGAMTPGTDVAVCQFSFDEVRLVVEEAHAAGLAVTAHAHPLKAVEMSLAAGVDGIEHCSCVTESGVQFSDSLIESIAKSGIAVCPTLGRRPGKDPPPAVLALWARFGTSWEARREMVGRMFRGGVTIVSGVDSGISDGKPHGVLAHALSDLVAGGVSPADSLASATSVAAKHCGLAGSKGQLQAGYDADLLVVAGDPTADIADLLRVQTVYVRGESVRLGRPATPSAP
jgi:imidazolonepropionase-like amidohydrolase